jgi:phosphosulfolactate phosphohydrolase-like enzyme
MQRQQTVRIWADLGEAGARRGAERGDVVVIIDALRASTTIIVALEAGARQVIPVLTVKEANAYLADPTCRVAGERGGARLPQFHYGNSPTEIWARRRQVARRALVLTTSNGTRCVHAALEGSTAMLGGPLALLAGAPINARAVARAAAALAQEGRCDVTLVAVGLGEEPAEEDAFALGVIGRRLADWGALPATPLPTVCEADSLDVFLNARSASRLARLGYGADVRFCAQVDLWDTVPVYRDGGFVASSQ